MNLYWNVFPSLGVDAGLKAGRFLGGDPGVRVDVRRTFKYFSVGFWYSATDTSGFKSPVNRGYQDKGVFFSIPLSIFFDSDLPGKFSYAIAPWTRDPGQTVSRPTSFYPF